MEQKLPINSIVNIRLPRDSVANTTQDMRCYVIDYNKDQRSYTVLPIRHPYRYTKSLLVREKVIQEVLEVVTSSPDFRNWHVTDALAFFSHEHNVLSHAVQSTKYVNAPTDYNWMEYTSRFKELEKHYNGSALTDFLAARVFLLRSRKLPLTKEKKSRTVMRRLRKKSEMRNSNSSMSKSKQRALYKTPTDIAREQSSTVQGVSTKRSSKKRRTSKKNQTYQDLYMEIQKIKELNEHKTFSFKMPPTPVKTFHKKRKKRLIKTTMPF